MSDTRTLTGGRTQDDGINFRGLGWFLVVLAITIVGCQILMVGLFKFFDHDLASRQPATTPLAMPNAMPSITEDGQIIGVQPAQGPALLTDEPDNLKAFRAAEDDQLTTYGVIDRNAGTYRIPVDRAKDLMLDKGFPVRGAPPVKGSK